MKVELNGVVAPIITVFCDDETIDEKNTRKHLNYLIDHGIQGIMVCASTGESIAMSKDERKRVTEFVLEEVNGRVPVYAATGDYRTKDTIDLSQHAEKAGAQGLMILMPYYMQPTVRQVVDYYRAVKDSVDLPIMLYDNPFVTGFSLSTEQIAEMFREGLIGGVKLADGDPRRLWDLRYLCGKDMKIFYGADDSVLECLLCGADGWISGILNLMPSLSRKLSDAARAGKVEEATHVWEIMRPIIRMELCTTERDPHWLSILKTALKLRGFDTGKPRSPISLLDTDQEQKLKILLDKVGIEF